MKYLIVSIYDSGYKFSICRNGKVYPSNKNGKYLPEYDAYWMGYDVGLNKYLEKYKDYDLIVVCEDGNVTVVKDNTKVVHAKWKWYEEWLPSTPEHPAECQEAEWICSNCESFISDEIGGYWDDIENPPKLKYCPHCGAKMDKR